MSERTTFTSLPPELFLTIFSHVPQRTIRTTVSPLETVIRNSPSKRALLNLSLSSSYLRNASKPFVFEAVSINSVQKLKTFVESGTAENVGRYVRRLWLRWESFGDILKLGQQAGREIEIEEVVELVKSALLCMPRLRAVQFDFPGSLRALEDTLAQEDALQELQFVTIRNGRWEFGQDVRPLFQRLGRLRLLKTLTIAGNDVNASETSVSNRFLDNGSFSSLATFDASGLSTLYDETLRSIVSAAKNLASLSIRNCPEISLSATRRLLISHGYKLRHLSLEIFETGSTKVEEAGQGTEHRHTSEVEHLCPVIRDCCANLKILDLYTDKICKEILFPAADSKGGSGAMTGGLPTPPGSPNLASATVLDIPTPPFEALNDRPSEVSSTMLPPPLFDFASEHGKPVIPEKREIMKTVSLRIPYDESCFGAGSGGPSLQQAFTSLCDGMPAKELLEIGMKAYGEGLVEVVNIRGHWKGGPYLIMKD